MKTGNAWVGYNDRKKEKKFVWVAGGKGYVKWCPKEPNNLGNEDCAELVINHKKGPCLNDLPCNRSKNKRAYICEINASKTIQETTVA